jgi:hypothetical protein
MKIQVGHKYKDAEGVTIYILERGKHKNYRYEGLCSDGTGWHSYCENGSFYEDTTKSPFDLIKDLGPIKPKRKRKK